MATISIGNAGLANSVTGALGNNAITNALGISSFNDGVCGPSTFLTKFGAGTIFQSSSLPYHIRSNKNFTVNFHWFPKYSQIRSYFANALGATDTGELAMFIRNISVPDIVNAGNEKLNVGLNAHFAGSIPGAGVNGMGHLEMTILATEFSLVDHCFYQWLRETESPYWIYPPFGNGASSLDDFKDVFSAFSKYKEETTLVPTDNLTPKQQSTESDAAFNLRINGWKEVVDNIETVVTNYSRVTNLVKVQSLSQSSPFTRADIEIKYYSANFKELHSVICYGAYPIRIETMDVDNEPGFKEGYRVEFAYDSIDVVSPFVADDSNGITNAVMGGAAKVAGALGGSGNGPAKWASTLTDGMLDNYLNKSFLAKASKFVNSVTNKAGSKISDKLNNVQKKMGVGDVLS
jgi:hypothetical protein